MLALSALPILIPLIYIPGYLIVGALEGTRQPPDLLERHYHRVVVGALLNGWLALTLAELGLFSAWRHMLLLCVISVLAALVAWRRETLQLPPAPLGIVAYGHGVETRARRVRARLSTNWDIAGFAALSIIFGLLVARPFEVVLGVRDAGVYANTGFAIARSGGIVDHDEVLARIGQDQAATDPAIREAARQAETNFLAPQKEHRNIATRLRVAGFYINAGELAHGRVVPQGFHLFPAWIGLLASLLGFEGGLLATGVMGMLGLWSVGMLGRRLAGKCVALLAMTFLAFNGVQVWFSRYSTTETTAQFLTFAGLYAFAVMHLPPAQPAGAQQQGAGAAVSPSPLPPLLAGLAFGQLALARIDFFLVVLFVPAYLGYVWLSRRWSRAHTILSVSFGLMLLHAAVHIAFIARAYFFDTLFKRLQDFALTALLALPFLTPKLQGIYLSTAGSRIGIRLNDQGDWRWNVRRITAELVILVLFVVGLFALRRYGQPLIARMEHGLSRRKDLLLRISASGIVLLAVYGYMIRPQVLSFHTLAALPGCLTPAQLSHPANACLTLQGYVGAPVAVAEHPNHLAYLILALPDWLRGRAVPPRVSDATRLDDTVGIAQANMVRLGWYLSPPGVVLGVAGFALWWRKGMNRTAWLFLAIGLITTIVFVRQSYGAGNQTYIYILRRYVPQVYPAFCLGMAYALTALGRWANDRQLTASRPHLLASRIVRRCCSVAAAGLALALVGFFIITNRTIYRHVEYDGALAQLEAIAGHFGAQDVLLFRGGDHVFAASRDVPDLITTPLRYMFGLNAFTIKSKEPGKYADEIARYVRHWQAEGRQVYFVLGPSGAVGLPGLQLEPLGRMALHLREFEQLTGQKPSNVQDFILDFAVYRPASTARTATLAVAVDEYAAQVRGLYRPEQINGMLLAWTDGDALVRLPWPASETPRTLRVRLAGGKRPVALGPAQACLSFRPEPDYWVENPASGGTFSERQCFDLTEQVQDYQITLDPRQLPTSETGTMLIRMESPAWVPAQAGMVPPSGDQRSLGVQFGGISITK